MLAMFMQVLDTSICVVALPYMQGSLSASAEEINWVLTASVISAAIMTAPVGWMAQRFGRKRLFVVCLSGFVVLSMMCGAAQTLMQLVAFRILQGAFGAGIAPLSQAAMLDIYPFSRRAQAMALFSMGVTMGPMLGPTLGGYLTDYYNWRWVFFVNLPFGIIAVTGLILFMPGTQPRPSLKFSWYGFGMLALGVAALQMVLDRGQIMDWFTSPQIISMAEEQIIQHPAPPAPESNSKDGTPLTLSRVFPRNKDIYGQLLTITTDLKSSSVFDAVLRTAGP